MCVGECHVNGDEVLANLLIFIFLIYLKQMFNLLKARTSLRNLRFYSSNLNLFW